MLTVYVFVLCFIKLNVNCENRMFIETNNDEQLIICITHIVEKYFSQTKELTYLDIKWDDSDVLKAVHMLNAVSLISRRDSQRVVTVNRGYLICAPEASEFMEYFDILTREPTWNPYAKFLIVIKNLQDNFENLFNTLLKWHVNNVLLVEGTNDANLYTYNPFENKACGRYFDRIISYGQCSYNMQNLFPDKVTNKLENCTFSVTAIDRPPYSVNVEQSTPDLVSLGAEQHIFKELVEYEPFNIEFKYNYGEEVFTTIYPNMTAVGPMAILQKNETDIIVGGALVTASRMDAFTCLSGHNDYVDVFNFVVKKASPVPAWQDFYLNFNVHVWMLLLIVFVVYSVLMIILLREKDRSGVFMKMLDNLLQHSYPFRGRTSTLVNYCFISWMWFTYLINVVYQSNLVSLTTNPIKEYQVSSEMDLIKFQMKACVGHGLQNFVQTENPALKFSVSNKECLQKDAFDNVKTASENKQLYTLLFSSFYHYNPKLFYNRWGQPTVLKLEKPYSKVISGIYFYKGFPISARLRRNTILMMQNGLMGKRLRDQYHLRQIKNHILAKEYRGRFTSPWFIYVVGCILAMITFTIEICFKFIK